MGRVTPVLNITVHDRSGLKLSGFPAPSDEEINQAELVGIAEATEWAKRSRLAPGKDNFWCRLHRQMFADVWQWAGKLRRHQPNIGVAPYQIQPDLRILQDDLEYWVSDECDITQLEILARFHHRLVFIHPFANGNGRWARLMTDVLATRELGLESLVWAPGADELRDPNSSERKKYIDVIKAADVGDFGPLMSYLKELNPGLD
jgi:Fic-DOC domain mobile mystery protein B